jgi:hypothetical protein
MRGAKKAHNSLAVAEAAHSVLAHVLRLSPTDGDPDLCLTAATRHTKQISWRNSSRQ